MPSESLSEFYESFHRSRGKHGEAGDGDRLSYIRQEVGTGKDVVELGCRYGNIIEVFKAGNRVTGVDIDRGAMETCRARHGIDVHLMNLNEPLAFPDAAFDVVVMTEVLEHLPYPDITLSEIARILRPGGRLVGSVPNATRLKNRLSFLTGGPVEPDPTHLHHFSRASLMRQLAKYFGEIRITRAAGRFVPLSGELFANLLLFTAERPTPGLKPPAAGAA